MKDVQWHEENGTLWDDYDDDQLVQYAIIAFVANFCLDLKGGSVSPLFSFSLLSHKGNQILNPFSRKYSKTDYNIYREQ